MLHGHLRPGYDYLLERKLTVILREAAASPLGPDLERFLAGAEALGYSARARTGMASEVAIRMLIQAGPATRRADRRRLRRVRAGDHRAGGTAGPCAEALPQRALRLPRGDLPPRRPGRAGAQASTLGRWSWERHLDGVSPQVRRPMTAYLERLHGTHARSTVQGTASELAHFGRFLARHDPGLSSLALLDRQRHIEPYLTEVAVGGQPPHRAADRRLHRQAAHPDRRQLPGRHRRVGLARGPGPAAGLPPRRAQAAAPAAPLPAPGRRTGAAGRAGGLAEPAARRRAAAAAGHRDAHRRADRPRAGLRARGPRLRRLAEGPAGQAAHRADGAHRRGDRRAHRPDRRAPLARPAAAPPAHRQAGRLPAHPPGPPRLGGHPARRAAPRRRRGRPGRRGAPPAQAHLCHRPGQRRLLAAGADGAARARLGGDEPALWPAVRRHRPRRVPAGADPGQGPARPGAARRPHPAARSPPSPAGTGGTRR